MTGGGPGIVYTILYVNFGWSYTSSEARWEDRVEDLVLVPDTVIARWSNEALVVHASGHEGGVIDVGISREPDTDGPPRFQVNGRLAPFAGLFPYGVTAVFDLADRPDEIVVVTRDGSVRVRVA